MPFTYSEQAQFITQNQGGARSVQQVFRGYYDDLVTLANTYTVGTSTYGTLKLRNIRIERGVGPNAKNSATMTLDFGEMDQSPSGGSGGASATATGTKWQMRHVQKMISIYRYCGDSQGASANRGRIEAWRKGTDAYLFDNFQWRDKIGTVHTLTDRDQLLAAKFRAGFETVMRFYPVIQKVSTLTKGKVSGIGQDLATKVTAVSIGAPTGWTDAATEWMKIGDDLTFDEGSGVQTRTESWMGEESFDKNFYGTGADRWDFGSV